MRGCPDARSSASPAATPISTPIPASSPPPSARCAQGDTRYGPPAGIPSLREAIVKREADRSGVTYDPADVIVTPGGKFALLTALMAVAQTGDEVLVPEPGWVSYGPCVRLAGGTPVGISMLDRIDEAMLERVVTPRTKAIIVNSPVNPTGRVFSAAEIASVLAFAERHDLWILFDQVYCDLLYTGEFPNPQRLPGGRERVLVIDSLSKTFGMTGWRLGYLALPAGLSKTILKFIQHSIYCVPNFVQLAGVTALSLSDELVPAYRRHVPRAARDRGDEGCRRCPASAASCRPRRSTCSRRSRRRTPTSRGAGSTRSTWPRCRAPRSVAAASGICACRSPALTASSTTRSTASRASELRPETRLHGNRS